MPGFERNILDRMISGGFMNKRVLGRPLKGNLRKRGKAGYVSHFILEIYRFI